MIKNLLKKGFALKNSGRYKHAIEIFYKALEEDNTSSEVLLEIADLYYLMSNYERSIGYIEQVIKINPKHVNAMKLLKKIFLCKNGYSQAEQIAQNVYSITSNIDDLVELMQLYYLQGKYDKCLKYDTFNYPPIMLEQGKSLLQLNRKAEAIELIEKAYSIEPKNQEIVLFLGKLYFEMGNYDKCIDLAKNIEINTNNPDAMNFLGLLETIKQNYTKAESYFLNAIKLFSENDAYYYNLANVYFNMGEGLLAKKYYNAAITKNPKNEYYHYALAKLYYMEKRYKKALEELYGNMFETRLLKVIILCETGYLALAKKEINELIKIQPNNQSLLNCKNQIDKELGL